MAQLKCLSVQQPWAWGIVSGPKRVENRSWRTRYRGPLLIHAGKSRRRLGDEGELLPGLPAYDELPFGAIVGVVDLVDCLPVAEVRNREWGEGHGNILPFAEGPWCWLLANPLAFERPVPYAGKQGVFGVPEEVLPLPTFAERQRLMFRGNVLAAFEELATAADGRWEGVDAAEHVRALRS